MQRTSTRRDFLQTAVQGACGAALAAQLGGGRTAFGIEPIARDLPYKFKFSLAAYSYRDLLTGASPQLTVEEFIRDCAKYGLEGTELTSYYLPQQPTPEYLRSLKELCFRLGLDVSGTAVGNDFCVPPGPKRDEQIAHVKRWIDAAEILGAPVIRIFSGGVQEGVSEDDARRLAVAGIEECCEYAGQHGIYLALENHGGLTATPAGLLQLVQAVRSPWFGVNLDTGNFHGADVYADLAQLAPYAVNVQIKVSIQPEGQPRQQVDFERLAQLLREARYRGYIVLEFEEPEDPLTGCPRYLEELRKAFV